MFTTGKNYQELRVKKRQRRQPGIIPDLPYLHWERTGDPPAGPYAVSIVRGKELKITKMRILHTLNLSIAVEMK